MPDFFRSLEATSLVTCALVVLAPFAERALAQSVPTRDSVSSPVMMRAPVPFERKSAPPAPVLDTAPVVRESAPDRTDGAASPDPAVRSGLDTTAAKAAVEADGYKRVTILGPGPNGAWRAKGYRGGTEVGLSVAVDGSVTTE